MSGFEGEVIFQTNDEFGDIIVAEGGMTRSLYFREGAIQSSMFVDFPNDIALYYVRVMMSALLFNRRPRRILAIGIGGGSGIKFLLRVCPDSFIDAVEIRPAVIEVARRFFGLPEHHERLRVFCMDGRAFVSRSSQEDDGYDHIFIDAYDTENTMDALVEREFLARCRGLLTADGLLTINLWTGPAGNYLTRRTEIAELFEGKTLELALSGEKSNAIIFALQHPAVLRHDYGAIEQKARELADATGINFPAFLRDIHRLNKELFRK